MDRLWAPWRMGYITNSDRSEKNCFLCAAAAEQADDKNFLVRRGSHCFAILNRFPYNNGHVLIAPYAHKGDLTDLTANELNDMTRLMLEVEAALKAKLRPHGFNVGYNIGTAAGAGLPGHIHGHIVPRWNGDTSFVTTLADVKVLSQSLEECYRLLADYFAEKGT